MRGLPSGAAILILGPSGAALGRKVRDLLPGARLYGPRHHASDCDETYDRVAGAFGPDEVGSHTASASPFGVQDMMGNVAEWTESSGDPED